MQKCRSDVEKRRWGETVKAVWISFRHMLRFVSAMVMLEERDDHIDCYLIVTELGYGGYVIWGDGTYCITGSLAGNHHSPFDCYHIV